MSSFGPASEILNLKTENKFKRRMKKIDLKRQVFCYQKKQVLIEKGRK